MNKTTKNYILIGIIFAVGLALDLITKALATGQNFSLIKGVVSIIFTWNTGAGFSILSDHTIFLTIFTGIMIVGLIVLIIFYKPNKPLFSVGIALVISGAIGNFVDRVIFGAVRDFIHLDFISFPVFNVADSMLTIGAILCCVYLVFFLPKKEEKNGK